MSSGEAYGSSPFENPPSDTIMGGGYGSHNQPGSPGSAAGSSKIFVGGLSPSVTSEGLIAHFSAYGEVVDATIMNDKVTGRPRGFGFVTFRQSEAVDALMQESHVLEGKQVECKRAVPMGYLDKPVSAGDRTIRPMGGQMMAAGGIGGQSTMMGGMHQGSMGAAPPMGGGLGPAASTNQRFNPEKIFVGGLPVSCDDAKLREYFSKYGVIVDAVVMIDRDLQRHRGFGYVLFQDAGSVDAAVSDHESHQIDGKWVDVKRCVVQDNTAAGGWPPQSGPMRKGFGKGAMMGAGGPMMGGYHQAAGGYQAPMAGSATMPGYGYGMQAGSGNRMNAPTGGYGGMPTTDYYGAYKTPTGYPQRQGAGVMQGGAKPTGYGMAPASGGYMTNAYGTGAAQPAYGYGPADPYASSAYGAPSPYGAMPGYGASAYGGYGTPAAYGAYGATAASGSPAGSGLANQSNASGAPPTSAGAANPNDVYAASRRSGYRTSPY